MATYTRYRIVGPNVGGRWEPRGTRLYEMKIRLRELDAIYLKWGNVHRIESQKVTLGPVIRVKP
jgi:hypothetical protein